MRKQAYVLISADVTGVGFRAWTLRQAQRKQLTGWVRNAGRGIVDGKTMSPGTGSSLGRKGGGGAERGKGRVYEIQY